MRNDKGYVLVILTVLMLLASLTAYLVMTHTSGVRSAADYLKNADSSRIMLSIRNLLIADAIEIGGLRTPDANNSLPAELINQNYNPPVTDVWGSEIKYCLYSDVDQDISGLAGRLISAGENKTLQTLCTDLTAQGDDIVVDIFAQLVDQAVIRSEMIWSPPKMLGANNLSSFLVREDGSLWAWGDNLSRALQVEDLRRGTPPAGLYVPRRFPDKPLWSASNGDFVTGIKEVSAGVGSGFLMLKTDATVWAAAADDYPLPIPLDNVVKVQAVGFDLSVSPFKLLGMPAHGLALKNDKTLWAWGWKTPSRQLMKAVVFSSAASVSVSKTMVDGHALGLGSDGTVWAWGRNDSGQLGNGSTTHSVIPVQVFPAVFLAVAAGGGHSLALRNDGTVWAWGLNDKGQLGDATKATRLTPVPVTGLPANIIAVSAGDKHSMALTDDGSVWAWGFNGSGQLGVGTTADQPVPLQVTGVGGAGFLAGVAGISAGGSHSLARLTDGTVVAWGLNSSGQLGDNSSTSSSSPVAVSVISNITAISAGTNHSLALAGDGNVQAWGANSSGRLGDTTTINRLSPVAVSGLASYGKVTAIAAGNEQSLAVLADGSVWSWGRNGLNFELGDETTAASRLSPVVATRLSGVDFVAAGGGSSFAKTAGGTVWGWGNGWPSIFMPAQVWGAGGAGFFTDIEQVASSENHTMVIRSDGSVWTWGKDNYGQLGDAGSYLDRIYPVAAGINNITAIAAGANHSLALKAGGDLWAWGLNSNGQLGIGSLSNSLLPAQVIGEGNIGLLTAVSAIAAGNTHSLALTGGSVLAWGANNYGQLGDGTWTRRTTPVPVADISLVAGIAAGGIHSLAFTGGGQVFAWGDNSKGQLANGTWNRKNRPVNVRYVRYVIH